MSCRLRQDRCLFGLDISGGVVIYLSCQVEHQGDDMKARVNAFIRGARVISERAIGDGSYEVEVELDPLVRTPLPHVEIVLK